MTSLSSEDIQRLLVQDLRSPSTLISFKSRLPPEMLPDPPRKAAVLIPMLLDRGHWKILYTRRTPYLPEHSGQVAFPGGRSDSVDEAPETTALREAMEEINLKPQDVHILGLLGEIRTISNYIVTPVIGKIPWPYPFTLATDEVSRVFTIPLDWLADPANHEIRLRDLPEPYPSVPVVYFNPYEGELLWGVSAEITLNLLYALQFIPRED